MASLQSPLQEMHEYFHAIHIPLRPLSDIKIDVPENQKYVVPDNYLCAYSWVPDGEKEDNDVPDD